MNPDIFYKLAVFTLPILFAITLHEVAHGWMANKLGDLYYNITGDSRGLNTAIKKSGQAIGKFDGAIKKTAGLLGSIFIAKKVFDYGSALIKLGSDAEESGQKFGVVFKSNIDKANESVQELIDGYGQSTLSSQTYQFYRVGAPLFAKVGFQQFAMGMKGLNVSDVRRDPDLRHNDSSA